MVDLDVVTAVYTHFVGPSTQRARCKGRVAAQLGFRGGQRSRINVGARGTDERLDLVGGGIHDKGATSGATTRFDDGFRDLVDGIHLGDVQRVDAALALEVDVNVVEHEVVGALDGGKVAGGRVERTQRFAIVAQHNGVLLLTSVARSTRAEERAFDAHVVGIVLIGGGGVVFKTVHIDI